MTDPLQTILDVAREIDVGLLQPRATRLREAYAALMKAQQTQPADVDKAIREYSESCEANYVPLKKVGELRLESAGLRAERDRLAAENAALRPVVESARRHNEAHKAIAEASGGIYSGGVVDLIKLDAQKNAHALHTTTAEELDDALEALDDLAADKTEDGK